MELLPVINCDTAECVAKRAKDSLSLVGPGGWVSLDVADGSFTDGYATWRTARMLRELVGNDLKIELHLMTLEPEVVAPSWLEEGIDRLIVHLEATTSVEAIASMCKNKGVEAVLGLAPETSAEHALPYLNFFAGCHLVSVKPGKTGQVFQEGTIEKIKAIRQAMPDLPISVDGGITTEIAKRCAGAGATRCAIGAALWGAPDPKAIFEQVRMI